MTWAPPPAQFETVEPVRLATPTSPPRPRRRWALAAILAACAALAAFAVWAARGLPVSRSLAPLPKPSLALLTSDGEVLARRGAYKGEAVDAGRLPRRVTDPVIAIEDRRFYSHVGVDARGTARALWANLRAGRIVEGGSTITQQLAKTAFLNGDRSLKRKIQEALIARWLEMRLGKREILSRYLSTVYYGDGVYGLSAAARHYFDKAPEDLTLGEAAMLAGVINAPSRLDPMHNLAGAQARARLVLQAMVEAGMIDAAQARAVAPAQLRPSAETTPPGSYFADWIWPKVKARSSPASGEVAVRSTLDSVLQRDAETIVRRALAIRGADDGAAQAALIAMRPDGAIVAMVGGRDYGVSQFNRATQARRQPGSAFKLFVYLAALRRGATPRTLVEDEPITLAGWSPENFEHRYLGPIPLEEAFALSSNVAAVRVARAVGAEAVIKAARDLGVTSPLGAQPSLALGTSEMSLIELTAAYAAVASGAYPVRPYGLAANGEARGPQAMLSPQTERLPLLEMMRAVVEKGTGRAARLPFAAFGKTGTTQDHRDALFVGFADGLIVGVWVGNDDHSPMRGVTGGAMPAQIWHDFMLAAHARGARTPLPDTTAPVPSGDETSGALDAEGSIGTSADAPTNVHRPWRGRRHHYRHWRPRRRWWIF